MSSENRAPNELVSMLQRNALERTTKISELTARIKVYDKQMSELKAMRHKILSIEPELSRLEHELVVAEKNYSLYINTLEKSRIDRELDNSRISNIAIIEHATFSPARVFPKSLLILFMALPAGVAVGLLVLYLCYLLDPRIHDGGLVEKRFGTPLWGTVMEADSESTHDLAFEASLYRLYGLLPLDRIRGVGLTVGLTSARHGEGVSFIVTHLLTILQERKLNARMAHDDGDRAQPGELVLLDASSLTSSQRTVDQLKQADIILLVIEARHSTIPVVENALSILKMAFGRIDGIILNRRRLEIPAVWLARMASVRGHG